MPFYSQRFHGCRLEEYTWRGHRLVVLENELLKIGVIASKGADILEFRYKPQDLDVLWHAPQPLMPPGQYIPTTSRAQGAFLDYFPGGWQEVFPNAGPAAIYRGAEIGQHGEVALQPWDVRIVEDNARRVEVEFSVETMRMPFRLARRMILESGSPALILDETVTHLGEEPLHYLWGHHPALGAPFLEEGCIIEMPDSEVVEPSRASDLKRRFAVDRPARYPELELVDGSLGRVDKVNSKEARTEDVLLFHGYREGRCAVRNPQRGLSFKLTWDPKAFPYFWCWQVYGGSFGYPYYGRAYTIALEPFNCPIQNLVETTADGVAPLLQPGATIQTQITAAIEVVTG